MSNATTLTRPASRQQTNTTQRPPRIPDRTPEPIPDPIPDPALEPDPPTPSPTSLQAPPRRHPTELSQSEQSELLEDYFDNSVDLATIASNARLHLFDLVQWLRSPETQARLDLIKAADLERAQRIAAHHAAVAMQAIAFIARQSPDSDRSMETIRKAATYIHRAAQPPKLHTRSRHRTTAGNQSQTPTQDQTQSQCEPTSRHDSAPPDKLNESRHPKPVPSTPPKHASQSEQLPSNPPLPSPALGITLPRTSIASPSPSELVASP